MKSITQGNREDIIDIQNKIDELRGHSKQKTTQKIVQMFDQMKPVIETTPAEPTTPQSSILDITFETAGRSFSTRPISFHNKRLQNRLSNLEREELLGKESPKYEVTDDYEGTQEEMKRQDEEQGKITNDTLMIIQDIKSYYKGITDVIDGDTKIIKKGEAVLDGNINKLSESGKKLETHRSSISMNLFSTLNMIIMVIVVFFSMMVFIKIFPKRL